MIKYEQAATRLEGRGKHPPTREYVDALVEGLLAAEVEASWHSAVDPWGRALFPSQVFPNCHPDANFESFHYLIDRLHEIGRPVVSWYSLHTAKGVAEAHPDWEMQFFPVEETPPIGASQAKFVAADTKAAAEYHYCCFNSPYGELLPKFAVEIVTAVGFDGLWFDGSTFANHHTRPMYAPGCKCDFCRRRFKEDTGLALPEKIDYEDHTFRVWVNWRYEVLMDVWRRIVEAVTAAKPEAAVCFNNYRRRTSGKNTWNTAIPLRALGLDAVMSGELDGFPGQADVQMKINRAYECRRGVETWWPLGDFHVGKGWTPDIVPLDAVQAALGCVSAGGIAACGTAVGAKQAAYALRQMQQAVRPRMPYLGGGDVPYAAILASQQTMDFWGKAEPGRVWDGIHGANEILRHSHLQSSVIFDDHLTAETLSGYPVVIAGNAACLSTKQAEALHQYVNDGGVLVACAHAGELDELGYPHSQPVLDSLLGIAGRAEAAGPVTMRLIDSTLAEVCTGGHITFSMVDLRAVPQSDVNSLAVVVERDETVEPYFYHDIDSGLWINEYGRGYAVYTAADWFADYLNTPTPSSARLFHALVTRLAQPPITLDGPMCITMNVREQADGTWAVHLHNAPGSAYSYPCPPQAKFLHAVGEVVPVHNLVLRIPGREIAAAHSGVSEEVFEVRADNCVQIPKISLHEVVVISFDR